MSSINPATQSNADVARSQVPRSLLAMGAFSALLAFVLVGFMAGWSVAARPGAAPVVDTAAPAPIALASARTGAAKELDAPLHQKVVPTVAPIATSVTIARSPDLLPTVETPRQAAALVVPLPTDPAPVATPTARPVRAQVKAPARAKRPAVAPVVAPQAPIVSAPAPAQPANNPPAPSATDDKGGDNSGSGDHSGSSDNSGSDDHSGSSDNSGSDDHSGSSDNSGSDDHSGSSDNSGSDDHSGSSDNSGSDDHSGSDD